jgi:hypothetical protein
MKKAGLFTWIFTATLFSVSPLTSLPAKAEGGCPKGLFPVGGGYCRNIVCTSPTNFNRDNTTRPYMEKYGLSCPDGVLGNMTSAGVWGDMMVPMRK